MENGLIDRLYYNRNKSNSYNLNIPQSTKNPKISILAKEKYEEIYKSSKINNDSSPRGDKNIKEKNGNMKLDDFNGFLEKLSNYENNKSYMKK